MQVLINNAGVLQYSNFDSVTPEDLLTCFRINAMGPLLVAQQLHKRGLIGGKRPTLIGNVTSKARPPPFHRCIVRLAESTPFLMI